jgi:hypothetical protein
MRTGLSNTTPEDFAKHVAALEELHRTGRRDALARIEEQTKLAAVKLGLTVDELRDLHAEPQFGTPEEKVAAAKAGAEKLSVTWADARHYMRALARWSKAGFPVRDQAEVERIESEICRPCEQYADGRCRECGCNVNLGQALVNKIRMGTETCPLDKWPGDQRAEVTRQIRETVDPAGA